MRAGGVAGAKYSPCPVGTKSEKGERSRNSYQLAPFQGWKGGEQ